jgi:hypothetical protein
MSEPCCQGEVIYQLRGPLRVEVRSQGENVNI